MSDDAPRTEEERAAFFEELMREERNRQPVNKFAVATLVFGLLGGLLAPCFGLVARSQIKERGERGMPLVAAGLAAFLAWVPITVYLVSTGRAWWQHPGPELVNGQDLTVGQCFAAPGMSGDDDVLPQSCTDWHTGEVFDVIRLPAGDYPGIVEQYDDALARCEAAANGNDAVADLTNGRVQVMTMSPESWKKRKQPRAVCYFRFANETNHPL